MAQEHDLFDDIIEISKGFDFLKNPLGGVTDALDPSAPQWNPADYKERPRGNTIPCLTCKNEKSGCKASKAGWYKVVDDWDYTSTSSSVYVRFTLTGGVTIGEVGFVDEEGYKCTFEVNSANVYLPGYEYETTEKQFTKDELTAAQGKTKNGNPLNLADEQKSFSKGKDRT